MKSYTILIIILLCSSMELFSSSIDTVTSKTLAANFMEIRRNSANEVLNVVIEKNKEDDSFYVVNFKEGGWAMVSAIEKTIPILGFSFVGKYDVNDEKPEAFVQQVQRFKDQILESKNYKVPESIKTKWDELKTMHLKKSSYTYNPGDRLLNVPGRGWVMWAQSRNYDGSCSPSYNSYFPSGNCTCPNKPAGCGPIAMAQIMWYWEWPISSSFGTYDYSLMPSKLRNSTGSPQADEIARFIYDCDVVNVTRLCAGTMSFVSYIEDAFNQDFGYSSAKLHIKNDWDYGSAWLDLLRSEIDLGRPILYRGDKCDLCTSKHIFVIDAYDSVDPDYFGFNFGHGSAYYNTDFFYLDNINPYTYDWTKNQRAIVGISPTMEETSVEDNIYDVSYSTVTGIQNEYAEQDISLPENGEVLVVENGGELNFIAGDDISLEPGFQVKLGGTFSTKNFNDLDIGIDSWTNAFTPNGDGVNDELCFDVENADSWEFEVFNTWGIPVFQSAGTINSNTVCVWNGDGVSGSNSYACILRFKNSYGRFVDNAYMITVVF